MRVTIFKSLLLRHETEPFWKRIVTGDEKWVLYENPKRKNQWLSPGQVPIPTFKPGLHPKKALLCIWWDYRGIIHLEMLKMGETINADMYCEQLSRLAAVLKLKRPALVNRERIIFHQDNAKPHTAKKTIQKLHELKWELMSHPPYSPDCAPSDYYLFRSLSTFLSGKSFSEMDVMKSELERFFAEKSLQFYKEGIQSLVERWQMVVNSDGNYIID